MDALIIQSFLIQYQAILAQLRIFQEIIPARLLNIDHIGFKAGSNHEYQVINTYLTTNKRLTIWNFPEIVSGREINYFELAPGFCCGFDHLFLELQDKRIDKDQPAGFDHIEAFPHKNQTIETVINYFKEGGYQIKETTDPNPRTRDVEMNNNLGFILKICSGPLQQEILMKHHSA